MCRLAAYVGSPRPISTLVYDAPHSLEVQSYRPRAMLSGHVNVDGTGVAWWPEPDSDAPLRYATERPPWSDSNLRTLAPHLFGTVHVALVRSATPGMPFGAETVGPFVADGLAFAHNGYVEQFDRRVARPLTEDLPEDLFADLSTRTDSTALFALVRAVVRDRPAATLGDCLAEAVARTSEVVRDRGVSANLSCVLTNGRELVALRSAVGMPPNTLHASSTPDGLRVASEPLDDSSWTPLDPETVFTHDLLLPPSTP